MRQPPLLLLTLLFGLISACNSSDRSQATSTSRLVPEPDIVERLQYQKAIVDTLFIHNRDNIEVLVKYTNKTNLIPFQDSILPDDTETSFNILRNNSKHIIAITESPYSQSGDWFLTLTHYFDDNGQTFAFERQTNFFNSGCTDGVAYETKTEYYDNEFKLVGRNYKLVDENGKDLAKDSCEFMYEYDYKVLQNVKEYLQVNKIKNGR
jgi:hypothetical protein